MFKYDVLSLTTEVVECIEKDGKFLVSLKDTCFYAESGGQPSDKGTVGGLEVLDVYKYKEETIHVLNQEVSGEVECVVDEVLRKSHSELHTAQHLLSSLFDRIDSRTSSLNIKDNMFSIDLSKDHSQSELDQIELEANALINKSIDVYSDKYKDELDNSIDLPNVDKSNIRIVAIEGIDRNPCGGTHVKNLSELFMLKIIKSKPSRGGTRIWVVAGMNGFKLLQDRNNLYNELVQLVGVEEERTIEFLEGRLKQFKKYKKQLKYIMKNSDFDIDL